MHSASENTTGFDHGDDVDVDDEDGWSNPLFELELIQPTPPPQFTPQPRLGPASLPEAQSIGISYPGPLTMSSEGPHPVQPSTFESAEVDDSQPHPTTPRDQHRRGYQACDPCRKRKVKCDLGSVDNPHDPPCMRCRREHKDCLFSVTRRKRKPSQDADDVSNDGGPVSDKRRLTVSTSHDGDDTSLSLSYPYSSSSPYPQSAGLGGTSQPRQHRTTSQPFQPRAANAVDLDMVVDSKPSADGTSSQVRSPRPLVPPMSQNPDQKSTNEHMLNKEAANILHPSIATSHEALHLLSVAAGQTEEANRQSSKSLPSHLRSPPTRLGTPGTTLPSHRPNTSHQMVAGEHMSEDRARLGMTGAPSADAAEDNECYEAVQTWSKMRLVKDGWFTPAEAMAYIEYYYEHLAPMTPVVIDDYRAPSCHTCLLVDEPILAITMLTIASRYMKLRGPGAISRAYQIHDVLWNNLRGMVQRLVWGQEQFGGSSCGGGGVNTRESRTGQITWKGSLRTLGTIEALLLLTDWHPRALHFPPGENETRILDGDFPSSRRKAHVSASAVAPGEEGKIALSSWLEPAWRSDRMSWMLLGAAVTLSFELSVFDKEHYSCAKHHGPESECARKQRVRRMVLVYVSQTSGRFGFTPMLSFKQWQTDPVFEETKTTNRQGHVDAVELMHGCWMGIAGLMYKANEEIFLSKQFTRDLTSSGQYTVVIARFKPMLQEWKANFDRVRKYFDRVMQHLLSMEYDYARLYINSLGLQKVVESWINISNEAASCADNLSSANHGVGVASAGSGGVTFSLLLDIWRPNKEYIDEVSDAARSILRAVMEGLVPDGDLTHASVRSYSRILSGLMFTLKRFSFGATEQGVRESLTLLDCITDHLSRSVVDDVHLSARTAELVKMLSSHLRAKFIRLQAPNSGSGGSSGNNTRHPTPHRQHDQTGAEPCVPGETVKEATGHHATNQFVFNNDFAPLQDPLAGIEPQSMSDVSNISYMPPLNYNAYMSGHDRVERNAADFGTGVDNVGDWFALPLDNFFSSDAAPVQQGFGGIGPTVGSKDMLELITNEQYDRWHGGDAVKQPWRDGNGHQQA